MSIPERWLPELARCLRSYSRADFNADLLAGLTVGLVALPPESSQSLGFRA